MRLEDLAALQRLSLRGDAVSVSEFLTWLRSRLRHPDQPVGAVAARAEQVEAFYADLVRADTDEDYIDLLTDHEK